MLYESMINKFLIVYLSSGVFSIQVELHIYPFSLKDQYSWLYIFLFTCTFQMILKRIFQIMGVLKKKPGLSRSLPFYSQLFWWIHHIIIDDTGRVIINIHDITYIILQMVKFDHLLTYLLPISSKQREVRTPLLDIHNILF